MIDITDLDRLIAERAITRVLLTYARAVDRQDWDLLRTVFHPDAVDDHGPYVGDVEGLIAFLRHEMASVDSATHAIANILIDHVDGRTARVETTAAAVHRHTRRDGGLVDLTFCVRYLDRVEERDGSWRIAHRVVVVDRSRIDAVVRGADLADAYTRGRSDREDPSYAEPSPGGRAARRAPPRRTHRPARGRPAV